MKQAIKWCSGYTHRFREALAAMTPAIELLNHLGHPYDLRTFDHPANAKNYAQAAATALNIPADQIFKTLLWRLNTGIQIVAIAAASEAINPKALAKLAGAPGHTAAGIDLHKRLGDWLDRDEPVATIHAEAPGELAYAMEYALSHTDMFTIESSPE